MKLLKKLLEKIQRRLKERTLRKQEAKYITTCDAGHPFNAMHQSGVCPHVNIGEYLWKPDNLSIPRNVFGQESRKGLEGSRWIKGLIRH